MIRDTLGEDAIIVATREENGGKAVRVTAAVESRDSDARHAPNFELGRGGAFAAPADDWLQYDDELDAEENSVSEDLTDIMLAHSVPEDVTDQVLSCAMVVGYRDVATALEEAIDHLFQFRPLLSSKNNPKPFMMVGPPGAGKTLLAAKLAARGVMSGQHVGVITTDTVRAGGVEQLEAFTRILKVDLKRVSNAQELARAINALRGMDMIIIDTAGTSPYDTDDVRNLARMLASVEVEPVLVMPAGMDANEAGEIARIFAAVGVRRLLPTRLDIGRRLGGLLAAAHQGGLTFAEASNSPAVADGLMPMNAQRLTQFLLPRSRKAEGGQSPNKNRKTSG